MREEVTVKCVENTGEEKRSEKKVQAEEAAHEEV